MKKRVFILICFTILLIGCGHKQQVKPYVKQTDTDTLIQREQVVNDYNAEELKNDSFVVKYRHKVHGYTVKAVIKMLFGYDFPLLAADFHFTKNGRTFMLHSMNLGDTVFSKGRYDPEGFNIKTFRKFRKKTILADYKVSNKREDALLCDVPFFFTDLDFDNVPELAIVHHGMAIKWHDGYDVYRIVEGRPVLIDVPPYNQDRKNWGFGMTDYPQFDYISKTILCNYPEGELKYEGCTTYAINKNEKDVVKVNGRKHYFNKMVKIKDEKYGNK